MEPASACCTIRRTAKHTLTANAAIRKSKDTPHEQELKRISYPAATKRTILRSQDTDKWLQTPPSYVNRNCLSEKEFRDALHLRYYRTPPNFHAHGCGAKFPIAHGLECKKGGLVTQRHVEITFELEDLAARALIP